MATGNLLHNGSGYRDPTAYEAIKNVSRERRNGGNKKVTAANRICIDNIKSYEIIIAKCGALCLKWITSPKGGNRFELYTGGSIFPVCVTASLLEAIEEYNNRVN